MTTTKKCPQCGAELAAETAQGLCPACLLQRGLDITLQSTEARPSIIGNPTIRYFGDYEIQREIARGGMGVVYKAQQVKLNRPVAVKMILAGTLADAAAIKRFHTEAEAAANLQHPNIVAIHEIGEHDGQHYFSMDYVEGKNLAEITNGKSLPATKAATYVKTMAEAIHYAHQRGTFHRDLKPSNVLIDAADQPRITDFGLAKLANSDLSLTRTGAVMGTANYMPPEQASGRLDQVGPQSDVYSLGAILYELLAGRPPFTADSIQATLLKVVQDEPTSPRKLNADVPVDLETICLKCLEKSPQRRYASARELAEDIGRFLKREPILARPISRARKVEQSLKRHPWRLAALAAVIMLGLSSLAYGLWQQNQFLVWINAHADYVRAAGPRTAAVKSLEGMASSLFVIVVLAQYLFNRRLRGQSWKAMLNATWNTTPPVRHPLDSRELMAHQCVGIGCLVFAFYFLMKLIDAYVWEGHGAGREFWTIYALIFFGFAVFMQALKQQRANVYGPMNPELVPVTQELLDRVLAALRDRDAIKALKIYRDATQCTLVEAKTVVDALAKKHGLELPPAKIDPTRLAVLVGIQCAVVAGLWFVFSPDWQWPVLAQFGGGWAAGMLIISGIRLKGWKRWVMMMSGFIVMMIADGHFRPDHESYTSVMLGMFAGFALVILSYKKAK